MYVSYAKASTRCRERYIVKLGTVLNCHKSTEQVPYSAYSYIVERSRRIKS